MSRCKGEPTRVLDERQHWWTAEEKAEYFASAAWRRQKDLALAAAGRRCQVCNGTTGGLDCHHRTYARFGNERPGDLTVLCRVCHELYHEHRRAECGDSPRAKRDRETMTKMHREVEQRQREIRAKKAKKDARPLWMDIDPEERAASQQKEARERAQVDAFLARRDGKKT